MKNKKIILLIIVVLSILLFTLFILFKVINDNSKDYKISKKKEIEVYSSIMLSDLVSVKKGTLIEDYKIDTTKIGKENIEFEYCINDEKYKGNFDIEIIDNVKPYASVSKTYTYVIGTNFNLEDVIFYGDNYTKNPTCSIVGEYDINKPNEYQLIYKVEDKSGNISEYPFTLKVIEESISSSKKNKITFAEIKSRLPENASLMIDVSKWQGDIDWQKVKESGINFAMIRLGTQIDIGKESKIDSYFEKNIKEAKENGIKVGVYYFSYARDEKEAFEQALWVIDTLKDYEIDLPIAFDWECWSLFKEFNINFYELNLLANTFLEKIKTENYKTILYSSKNYLENVWDLKHDVWLAHYTENTTYQGNKTMWQFTNVGEIPGINGNVDVNFYYNK